MKAIVAGNWKMNHGPEEARAFLTSFGAQAHPDDVTVLLFPPAVSLTSARAEVGSDGPLALGVQNIHFEASGAYTGEISAEMARMAGAEFALVGHSERRHVFGESDEETARKVSAAFRAHLTPILCVGETLEERQQGRLEHVLTRQLDAVLRAESVRTRLDGDAPLWFAYEPVWAIGTGETATPADASEAHGILREHMGESLGMQWAAAAPILYGGSVNPANARELLTASGVDGVLVGGASLDPASFTEIVRAAAG